MLQNDGEDLTIRPNFMANGILLMIENLPSKRFFLLQKYFGKIPLKELRFLSYFFS